MSDLLIFFREITLAISCPSDDKQLDCIHINYAGRFHGEIRSGLTICIILPFCPAN